MQIYSAIFVFVFIIEQNRLLLKYKINCALHTHTHTNTGIDTRKIKNENIAEDVVVAFSSCFV